MRKRIEINPIGQVKKNKDLFELHIEEAFREALTNIDAFSHLQVIWWGHLFDAQEFRQNLLTQKPYKTSPETLGIFATRAPVRPNPILLTTIPVIRISQVEGIIETPYIDAEDGSPILDIKPYNPFDRVKDVQVPEWCNHWPEWYEESARFDWQSEFNF